MRTGYKALLAALCLSLLSAAVCFADASKMTKFEKMMSIHAISVMVGGAEFEGLLIGSQGKLTFVCLDRKLGAYMMGLRPEGRGADDYNRVPSWLRQCGNYYMKRKGRTFFAVQVSAGKQWNFDLGKIRVGEYTVAFEDLEADLPIMRFAEGDGMVRDLPISFQGELGFYVPNDMLKPGALLSVGYGDNVTQWTVPGR